MPSSNSSTEGDAHHDTRTPLCLDHKNFSAYDHNGHNGPVGERVGLVSNASVQGESNTVEPTEDDVSGWPVINMTKWQRIKPVVLRWIIQPTHMAAFWLFLTINIVGTALLLFQTDAIKFSDEKLNKSVPEKALQYLTAVMTLAALASWPQRLIWLYQRLCRPKNNRAYFDRFFPFEHVWPKRTLLILLIIHTNVLAQFVSQFCMLFYNADNRPPGLFYTAMALGAVTGFAGSSLPRSRIAYLKEHVMGKKAGDNGPGIYNGYEDMVLSARMLHKYNCQISIRISYPGQLLPLEYSYTPQQIHDNESI